MHVARDVSRFPTPDLTLRLDVLHRNDQLRSLPHSLEKRSRH